jgi:hypothetical protein
MQLFPSSGAATIVLLNNAIRSALLPIPDLQDLRLSYNVVSVTKSEKDAVLHRSIFVRLPQVEKEKDTEGDQIPPVNDTSADADADVEIVVVGNYPNAPPIVILQVGSCCGIENVCLR